MNQNSPKKEKEFVEISQKQNLDSITINLETIRKIRRKNTWRICPDFAWPQIPNPKFCKDLVIKS